MEAGEKKTEIEQTNGGIGMSSSSNSRVTAPTGSIISRPTRRISEEDSAVSWFLYCEQHEGSPRSTNKEVDVHRDDEEFGMRRLAHLEKHVVDVRVCDAQEQRGEQKHTVKDNKEILQHEGSQLDEEEEEGLSEPVFYGNSWSFSFPWSRDDDEDGRNPRNPNALLDYQDYPRLTFDQEIYHHYNQDNENATPTINTAGTLLRSSDGESKLLPMPTNIKSKNHDYRGAATTTTSAAGLDVLPRMPSSSPWPATGSYPMTVLDYDNVHGMSPPKVPSVAAPSPVQPPLPTSACWAPPPPAAVFPMMMVNPHPTTVTTTTISTTTPTTQVMSTPLLMGFVVTAVMAPPTVARAPVCSAKAAVGSMLKIPPSAIPIARWRPARTASGNSCETVVDEGLCPQAAFSPQLPPSQATFSQFPPLAPMSLPPTFPSSPIKQVTATPVFTIAAASPVTPIKKELLKSKTKRNKHEDERIPGPVQPIFGNQLLDWELLLKQKKEEKSCASWMAMFEKAKRFKETNGHCWISSKIPAGVQDGHDSEKMVEDDDHLSLRRWARTQRINYATWLRKGGSDNRKDDPPNDVATLNLERIEMLNSIGFMWEFQSMQWWKTYDELVDFKRQFGHTLVPAVYRKNRALGSWVRTQRRKFIERKLSQERLEALNRIGFEFMVRPGRKKAGTSVNTCE